MNRFFSFIRAHHLNCFGHSSICSVQPWLSALSQRCRGIKGELSKESHRCRISASPTRTLTPRSFSSP